MIVVSNPFPIQNLRCLKAEILEAKLKAEGSQKIYVKEQ